MHSWIAEGEWPSIHLFLMSLIAKSVGHFYHPGTKLA